MVVGDIEADTGGRLHGVGGAQLEGRKLQCEGTRGIRAGGAHGGDGGIADVPNGFGPKVRGAQNMGRHSYRGGFAIGTGDGEPRGGVPRTVVGAQAPG